MSTTALPSNTRSIAVETSFVSTRLVGRFALADRNEFIRGGEATELTHKQLKTDINDHLGPTLHGAALSAAPPATASSPASPALTEP